MEQDIKTIEDDIENIKLDTSNINCNPICDCIFHSLKCIGDIIIYIKDILLCKNNLISNNKRLIVF